MDWSDMILISIAGRQVLSIIAFGLTGLDDDSLALSFDAVCEEVTPVVL